MLDEMELRSMYASVQDDDLDIPNKWYKKWLKMSTGYSEHGPIIWSIREWLGDPRPQ